MINLIPNPEKKLMRKNFFFRLATVLFIALACVALIASMALLPSYFISVSKKVSVSKKLEAGRSEPLDALEEKTLSAVNNLDKKLSILEKAEKEKFLVSEKIISEIVSEKSPDIKLTEIYFEDDILGKRVGLRGTAPSRERLLYFRLALEENPFFDKVDLPISNFIKGSNIKFDLNLVPRQSKAPAPGQ